MTTIEWVKGKDGSQGKTWNPVTGCNKISAGCTHCYAADIAKRFWGDRPFEAVQFHPERLEEPLRRRKPTMWFVNSMSDLFHEKVTDEQLDQVFAVMAATPHHTYQVLTKRPRKMLEYCNSYTKEQLRRALTSIDVSLNTSVPLSLPVDVCPPKNIWLGVTVENQKEAEKRIPLLLKTPAAVRFLSVEPMLEEINLELINDAFYEGGMPFEWYRLDETRGIKWVICGGESGHQARPFNLDWARSLRDQCKRAGVPFFMKQAGSNVFQTEPRFGSLVRFKASGKGNKLEDLPEDLRIREMPNG